MKRVVVLDSNILLLLVVSAALPDSFLQHGRLRMFSRSHVDKLRDALEVSYTLIVTPHGLTEVSNLLDKPRNETGADQHRALAAIIAVLVETYSPATTLVKEQEFEWLGLADVALLSTAAERAATILTIDGPLCEAAFRRGVNVLNVMWPLS